MTRSRVAQELLFPLTDTTVLIAILFFTLASVIVRKAGVLGLWLGVLLLPALFKYLLMLLEARAHGARMPVASIESFNPADNFWTLAPLVLVCVAAWGGYFLYQVAPPAGELFAAALAATLPAVFAVLALTRSPRECLDPRVIGRMIVACGPAYALAPAAALFAVLLLDLLHFAGAPLLLQVAVSYYGLFLAFTLTGALLNDNDVQFAISIPEPLAADEATGKARHVASRRQVLTHAYGFFSRDNRAGGLAHLREALQQEPDEDEAWRWYLAEMFKWESKDAALMLAQTRLKQLLEQSRDVEAVKLMSRCLLADARFRPLPDDRESALEVAERLDRDDLVRAMDLRDVC